MRILKAFPYGARFYLIGSMLAAPLAISAARQPREGIDYQRLNQELEYLRAKAFINEPLKEIENAPLQASDRQKGAELNVQNKIQNKIQNKKLSAPSSKDGIIDLDQYFEETTTQRSDF